VYHSHPPVAGVPPKRQTCKTTPCTQRGGAFREVAIQPHAPERTERSPRCGIRGPAGAARGDVECCRHKSLLSARHRNDARPARSCRVNSVSGRLSRKRTKSEHGVGFLCSREEWGAVRRCRCGVKESLSPLGLEPRGDRYGESSEKPLIPAARTGETEART